MGTQPDGQEQVPRRSAAGALAPLSPQAHRRAVADTPGEIHLYRLCPKNGPLPAAFRADSVTLQHTSPPACRTGLGRPDIEGLASSRMSFFQGQFQLGLDILTAPRAGAPPPPRPSCAASPLLQDVPQPPSAETEIPQRAEIECSGS